MAFEKIEQFSKMTTRGILAIHIRMAGHIYFSEGVLSGYPITDECRTVNIYIDVEKALIAILPSKEAEGTFRLSISGHSRRQICCSRFLDHYNIERNQKCLCTIEDVDGKRMIVFPVKFNKDKKDA